MPGASVINATAMNLTSHNTSANTHIRQPIQSVSRAPTPPPKSPTSPSARALSVAGKYSRGHCLWAVHRMCISVDICVEAGVENLWISTARYDITAVNGHTTRRRLCGQNLFGVSSQVTAPGVLFQTHFPDVKAR